MSPRDAATSRTLLQRVRDPGDREAWERFFALYAPLLEEYARAQGLSAGDAEEVRDECLAVLARKLPGFVYDRSKGGFQGWLYRLVRGRVIDRLRRPVERGADTAALVGAAPHGSPADEVWERTWRNLHLRYALERVKQKTERSFHVFELLLFEELPAAQVAARLGLSTNQVYKAKARILDKVRDELERLGTDAPLP